MEIFIPSTVDGTDQPSLFFPASGTQKRPLLVGLHTWSFNRTNQQENLLPIAEKYNFHLLLPEFRGPNTSSNPNCRLACGSETARQDVYDAIAHIQANYPVDADSIFLLGLSGGGHMALMLAAFAPELFRAAAAFVPVCDLNAWSTENPRYTPHILACCETEEEMRRRSPISHLAGLSRANIKLFHGKHDKVVPCTQSIRLYNALIASYPEAKAYLDIFDGAHQLDMTLAVHFILSQYQGSDQVEITR